MFTFGRYWRAGLQTALLVSLPLVGSCSSLTDIYSTPTSQVVCSDLESGVKGCGGSFDSATCLSDLTCTLGLYRAEAIDMMLTCVDRFDRGLCPAYMSYFCLEADDLMRRAALVTTPLMTDYATVFPTKQAACQSAGITIDSALYDQRLLMRDQLFYESRPCLDEPCQIVSSCLHAARQTVSIQCP